MELPHESQGLEPINLYDSERGAEAPPFHVTGRPARQGTKLMRASPQGHFTSVRPA